MSERQDRGFDPARDVLRSFGSKRHPCDGLTASIHLGDGAWSRILDPQSFDDGGLSWCLTYNDPADYALVAASTITSYDYLLSGSINMREATRRLRILRAARRYLAAAQHRSGS